MAAHATERSRVFSEAEILELVPTLPYQTSCSLSWSGIEVQRYSYSRPDTGETKDQSYPQLAVFVSHNDPPCNMEVAFGGVKMSKQVGRGAVSVVPPFLTYRSRGDGPAEFTVVFLDSAITAEIAQALTGLENPEIEPQFAIQDPLIRSIVASLEAEIASGGPHPRIYAETLGAALGAHIFAQYARPVPREVDSAGLKITNLRRGIEFMKANLAKDLSLADLAQAAGMSKYHFAKSFKAALGVAPHRYLVRLRVERARKLLAAESLSVEEIAASVGYSDTAHFAEQFRKFLGISPSSYRRSK